MPAIPLRYQIALAPALMLGIVAALLLLSWYVFEDLRRQNEGVHRLGVAIEHLQSARAAAGELALLLPQLRTADERTRNDLAFNYLEQSTRFSEHALHPVVLERVTASEAHALQAIERDIRYRDELALAQAQARVREAIPLIADAQAALWAQKRAAYQQYYAHVNATGERALSFTLALLVTALLLGSAIAAWTWRKLRARLARLAADATASGTVRRHGDELDAIADGIRAMTARATATVANERLLAGADEERRRIAMDLHDEVLAELTATSRTLEALAAGGTHDRAELAGAATSVKQSIHRIRAIMDDLHPQTLDLLGLEAALRSYLARRQGRDGPRYRMAFTGGIDAHLPPLARANLYRIATEAIANVERHARASECYISFQAVDNALVLRIEDNGTGFDPQLAHDGRGLANMRRRAQALGATIAWCQPHSAQGTCVEIRLTGTAPKVSDAA